MNSETAISPAPTPLPCSTPSPAAANGSGAPPDIPPTETPKPPPTPKARRSPRGKVGRLPWTIRDRLNFMLRDGTPYREILTAFGDTLKGITPRNVSNWRTSPSYQHWLLEQDWLDELRTQQEPALALLDDFDASKFNEGALQLAVTRLFVALRHLDAGTLNEKLGGNARTFSGLVHALARACRESTHIEKYREACARAIAAELKQLNIDRDLSDREYQLLVNRMDQVFKVPRRPPSPARLVQPAPQLLAALTPPAQAAGTREPSEDKPTANPLSP